MYTFRPFVFEKHEPQNSEQPKARSGHRIVCDQNNLYSYGGFNPYIPDDDPDMQNDQIWLQSRPLFKELWRFNLITHRWKRLPGQENMPNELASTAVILRGNMLFIYGGTGVPFGESCSNQLYICNIKDGRIRVMSGKGDFPEPQYGHALFFHGPYLYTVGGTTGYDYTCDIHRVDLRTGIWENVYICAGRDQCEPKGRYRHELAYDGKRIYVLGGGTAMEAFGFSEIPTFDLEANKWMILNTQEDNEYHSVPAARRCHGMVQYMDEKTGTTSAVIVGGYNGTCVFCDVWRLDLKSLQWTCMKTCILPNPVYFHSTALTPQGRMYTFGGIIKEDNDVFVERTAAVHSVWLTIPKLTEICWEALNYYNENLRNKTPDELLHIGIPLKFIQRIEYDTS